MPKIDKIDAAMDKIGELDVKAVNKVVGLLGTSEIFANEFQGALREFPALVKEGSKALNLLIEYAAPGRGEQARRASIQPLEAVCCVCRPKCARRAWR